MKIGGFVIFFNSDQVFLGRILSMYQKISGRHAYVESDIHYIDALSYISLEVFINIHTNYFVNYCTAGCVLFAHVAPKNVVYYIRHSNAINFLNVSAIQIEDEVFSIFDFFFSNKHNFLQAMKHQGNTNDK